jgi:hypothetical protein
VRTDYKSDELDAIDLRDAEQQAHDAYLADLQDELQREADEEARRELEKADEALFLGEMRGLSRGDGG